MKPFAVVPYLAAAVTGVIHAFVTVQFWGRYAIDNPLNNWLLEVFAKNGHSVAYYLAIYGHDVAVNFVLALPFAALIAFLWPRFGWTLLAVTLSSSVVTGYWGIFLNFSTVGLLVRQWSFWTGLVVFAIPLPLAFAALRPFKRKLSTT